MGCTSSSEVTQPEPPHEVVINMNKIEKPSTQSKVELVIPEQYVGIITTQYGPEEVWDRHSPPPKMEMLQKMFTKDDEFDKKIE